MQYLVVWIFRIHIYIESFEYTSGYINFFYYKLKGGGGYLFIWIAVDNQQDEKFTSFSLIMQTLSSV